VELHRIFGDSDRAATSHDLREMQYLELCIKEAMRMFPVAPIIGRHLTGDVALCKYPDGRAVPTTTAAHHATW
jgi:cytochrome P450 family 4